MNSNALCKLRNQTRNLFYSIELRNSIQSCEIKDLELLPTQSYLITTWTWEMKVRVVCRKIYDYIRYDLKEIAFPSSLPDPPHLKKRRKLTWEELIWVLKRAARLYAASWVHDIGPDLRPDDYKKDEMTDGSNAEKKTTEEPSTLEDLAKMIWA